MQGLCPCTPPAFEKAGPKLYRPSLDCRPLFRTDAVMSPIITHSFYKKKGVIVKIFLDPRFGVCYTQFYLWKWGFLFVCAFSLPRTKPPPFPDREAICRALRPAYTNKEVPLGCA